MPPTTGLSPLNPPALSLQSAPIPPSLASPTDQPPSTSPLVPDPAPSTTNQSTHPDTSSTMGIAYNPLHIPHAVTFSGVPYIDASHGVFHQAGRYSHLSARQRYVRSSGDILIFYIHIILSHLHSHFDDGRQGTSIVPAHAMPQRAFHRASALSGNTTAAFRFARQSSSKKVFPCL
jgi:hypothetical protein